MNMTQELKDALDMAGYNPTDYSGRGMFGKYCVGVSTRDSAATVVSEVVAQCRDVPPELLKLLGAARTDSLGMGYIHYWPSVPWEEAP